MRVMDDEVQGDPAAKICRWCLWPKIIRNGALVCRLDDLIDETPLFREPGR